VEPLPMLLFVQHADLGGALLGLEADVDRLFAQV
jgi:hypothetical protein